MITKNCPFCGGDSLVTKSDGVNLWYCFCYSCKAKGALGETKEEAIEKWNTRAEDSMQLRGEE